MTLVSVLSRALTGCGFRVDDVDVDIDIRHELMTGGLGLHTAAWSSAEVLLSPPLAARQWARATSSSLISVTCGSKVPSHRFGTCDGVPGTRHRVAIDRVLDRRTHRDLLSASIYFDS